MKTVYNINATAARHDVALPDDLLALFDGVKAIDFPKPNYNALVAQVATSVANPKAFAKARDEALAALNSTNSTFENDVRRAAASHVERTYVERAADIYTAFEPTLLDACAVLNEHAKTLPRECDRVSVMDADLDVIAAFRAVERASQVVDDIASALKPIYRGKGNHAARFAGLLVTPTPSQFPSLAEAVRYRDALIGQRESWGGGMSRAQETHRFAPAPALAAFGVTFEPVAPGDGFVERVERLDEALKPKTYRDEGDSARLYEQRIDAMRALIL